MDGQTLDTHKKILGIIYVITACFALLIAIFIRAFISIIFDFAMEDGDMEPRVRDFVMSIISFVPAIIIVFSVIPTLIAGIGLLTRSSWAPIFSLIIGCLKLISFPIGTIIGIYAIWIFAEDQRLKRLGNA
jgi:putative exporter of polyketide antibiotics